MRTLLFAANWKMNLTPAEARRFAAAFLQGWAPRPHRDYWFFPSSVSLEATAHAFAGQSQVRVGVQDIYWEPKGAFTGATSAALAKGAGAMAALVGHSERRHVFGETNQETNRKVRAALGEGLTPVLCVGELLEQRDRGETEAVVLAQLDAAASGLSTGEVSRLVVAYEPVWAIGTGRNASPADAAAVHATLRRRLRGLGAESPRILYGGSVNLQNIGALLAEPELDGVLVGGASLVPESWRELVDTVV
jgi:triosephosphate isomerase